MDTLVIVWSLTTGEKVHTLRGHKLQVTGVVFDNEDIVSSSVDCTLRRWRKGQVVDSWEAHKSAVQAVIKLPSGELVSGSSDTTVKLWKGKTCLHTFVGHTDTVRSLAVMPDLGVLSASHDGSIRLWALTGEVLMEMVGHTSIVYSVDSHCSGVIVSGSEDRSAKIWKDGSCVQSIEHPGCVWDAKFLENGDIVTACSDGIVRVWTTNQDRIADKENLEHYNSQITEYKLSRKRVGGLKLEELPGLDALQIPGTSDGQTKVIREGDSGVAYAWNLREQQWDKIGEVVDGPDDGVGKPKVLDGTEYDFVFDVDIGDGEPIRKLPYNRSDNPYDTADKWLLKENLPLSYRQQVVEFILQNAGQTSTPLNPSFRDPYTGGKCTFILSYISESGVPAKPSFKHIPKKGMLVFDVAQYDGIMKKMSEFNNVLLSEEDKKKVSLSELEVSRLGAIIKVLKDTSHYHTSKLAEVDIDLLLKLLKTWPPAMSFPAPYVSAIDILRMTVLHPDGANLLLKHVQNENGILMETFRTVTGENPLVPNLLTTIRLVTNLFKNSSYHNWLLKHRNDILDVFSNVTSCPNKNVQLSYSTMILNYAVLLIAKKDEEGQYQVLSAAFEMAEHDTLDADTKFRALVAIGSLMLDGLVKAVAQDLGIDKIAKAAKSSANSKLSEVGADIEMLAKQS
ncbi:Phospholipase A-2-activating protein [Linum perenne]